MSGRVAGSLLPLGERVWHKNGAMTRRVPPPLDDRRLNELALRYVGKYATTRAKLRMYLQRKLRERGWEGQSQPDLAALADRFATLGYVDDAAFALGKARSLGARGYGERRVADELRVAGVDAGDRAAASTHAHGEALDAALRFARRKRIGPFSSELAEREQRQKWIGAMIRAGHGFAVARVISALPPGAVINLDQLRDDTGLNAD